MIRNIVFGGCSLTWGQSLHYHSGYRDLYIPPDGIFDGNKLNHRHYQYILDNRFATKVSDYFGRKSIVRAENGGENCQIVNIVDEFTNENTDVIIIQTTAFSRCKDKSITEQIDLFLNLLKKYEKNIIIKFIHWDIPIEFLPKEILDKTIFFNDKHSFWDLLMHKDSKYSIEYSFGIPDKHFNQDGHDLIANTIIKELEPLIKKPRYE